MNKNYHRAMIQLDIACAALEQARIDFSISSEELSKEEIMNLSNQSQELGQKIQDLLKEAEASKRTNLL